MEKRFFTHLFHVLLQCLFGTADLVDPFRKLHIDNDTLVLNIVCSLLQNAIYNPPEGAGGIAHLLCLQDVLIGERTPLVWSDRAKRRESAK